MVVPTKLQQTVLQELHTSHPGIPRVKFVAHSHVWWPGIDKEKEQLIKMRAFLASQASTHGCTTTPIDLTITSMEMHPYRFCRAFSGYLLFGCG